MKLRIARVRGSWYVVQRRRRFRWVGLSVGSSNLESAEQELRYYLETEKRPRVYRYNAKGERQ